MASLPACCILLEEALFRLHSDATGSDSEDDERDVNGAHGTSSTPGTDPWLAALSDSQLLSAQQAFRRAILASLEFVEAIRTEAAEAGAAEAGAAAAGAATSVAGSEANSRPGTRHPLLPPVVRLISGWLAQPSAMEMLDPYDRACSLLPLLRDVARAESGAWADHLRAFERRERGGEEDADGAPGHEPQEHETMAELFSRLMPERQAQWAGSTAGKG